MARKQEKRFLEEAKRIMDENIYLARFNETIRNIEKLKAKHIELVKENEKINKYNIYLKDMIGALSDNNLLLYDQINFLEEIINSLHIIVSIKDLNRKNLLWYNQNYNRLLGYKHKELQELHSKEELNFYHPEDRSKIEERKKIVADESQNHYSCVIRLRHVNGSWIRMNSDYIVFKRNPDGSQSQAIEILTNVEK